MAYYGFKPAEQAIQIGDNTIVSADIADGSIVNADLNSSAAIAMSKTQLVAGTGITLATNTLNVDAAQTTLTSILNASLVAGRDADNQIKFSTDDQIIFRVAGGDGVTMKASGEIEATSLDVSGDIDVDGTTNLDVVDIDGAVDMASTLAVANTLTVGAVADEADAIITNGADGGRYDVLTVKENGNPRWNLSFEGSGSTNSLTLNSNSEPNVMHWDNATGNVGIGQTAPSQKLHLGDGTDGTRGIMSIEGAGGEHLIFSEAAATGGGALALRPASGTEFIIQQDGSSTAALTIDTSGNATFAGQIINTGDCSFRNGEILMANDRFDVLGGQDRRITLGTIGTPGQNSSHNVRGRPEGLYLNAPSKIVGEIDGSAKWEMTSSSTSFNNQLNINDDAFTYGDGEAKVYNFTFHSSSGFTSATEYLRIENTTGNWVWCLVEVTVISGFGSSSHYGKQKREYLVRVLGDNSNGNGVTLTTSTIGTDSGASEGVITLTTVGNEVTDSLLFKVQTAGGRRTSVFTKVYASTNQYLTITGQ